MLWLLAVGKFDQRAAVTWWRSNGQEHVTHVLGKLGAANRTEAGAGPGNLRPGLLTPHPGRPGNTFS